MAERELTLRFTFEDQASAALQSFIDRLDELSRRARAAQETVSQFGESRQAVNDAIGDQTAAAVQNTSDALDELGVRARAVQESVRQFGEFRQSFNDAFGALGQPITSLGNLNAQLMSLAGSAAASGVMMLGNAVKQSVTDFMEYETQLGDLARTANLSGEATDTLGESLRRMALIDLKGQASAQELAKIATIAGTLGMSAPTDIESFTAAIVRLSVATGENTEKVANNFARLGGLFETQFTARGENVYQSFDKIGSAFDALNDKIANVSFDPFLDIAVRIGKISASMGLTIDQTAAFAASINSLGFTAEAGSTAFKKFVTVIQNDSEKVARAFKLPVDEFVTAVQERPAEAIQMLLTQMNKMGSGGGAAMQDLTTRMQQVWGKGSEVKDLMLAMSQNVDRVNQSLEISNTEYEKGTRTFDSFAEKAKLTASEWKAVDTNLKDIRLTMGTLLAPAVKTVTGELAESSRFWAEAFSRKNVDSFFDAIVGGAEETIAPLQQLQQMDLEGKFAVDWPRAMGGADDALSKMRELYQEQESVIKSNSGLSAMFVEVFQQVETATKAGIEPSAELQQQMLDLRKQISEVGQSSSNIDDLNAKLDASKTSAQGFVASTKAGWEMMVTGAATAAKQYVENWQTGVEMIIQYFEQGWETIKAKTEQLWINVSEKSDQAWQAMSGKISETWQSLMTTIDQQWQGIVTSIQTTGATLWTSITESGTQVWTSLKTAASEFWTWLTEQPAAFVTAAQTAFAEIETQIKAIPTNVAAAFSGIAASARSELAKITDGLPAPVQKILGIGGGVEKITLPIDAAPTLDALSQIRTAVAATGDEALKLRVNDVFSQMQKAIRDNVPVSDELQTKFQDVTQELETLGYVSHGGSVWPDMGAAITAVQPIAQQLQTQFVSMTGDLNTMGSQSSLPVVKQQIEETEARIRELKATYDGARDAEKEMSSGASARAKELGAEIKSLQKSISDRSRTVFGIEEEKQVEARIKALAREKEALTGRGTAGAAGSKQIKDAIEQEQEKLRQLKDNAKDLAEVEREREKAAKEAEREREKAAKEAERAAKAWNDASERLFQARKKEADESVQWIGKLDEAAKKRLFAEGDALKVLQEQGVVLNDLQQIAVWRMQQEYKVAAAQEKQLQLLQAQMDPLGTIADKLGGLSSGVGKLGDLFGFDTSGIDKFLGKAQGFAQLPQTIKGITDSIGGIGQALGGLGNIGSSIGGVFQSLGGMLGGGAGAGGAGGGLGGILSGLTSVLGGGGAGGGGLGGILSGITGSLGGLGSSISGVIGSIGGGLSGVIGSLGGVASAAVGGIGSMLGGLGSLAAAAGPVGLGIAAAGAAIYGLVKAFEDTETAGTKAANKFQEFVKSNIEGGAELEAALNTNFDAMTSAGFDFATFMQQTGTTMDQTFGGISASWETGTTAMDLFTQAVGAASGDMEKAPQIALQMMASFQDMGLSAEEAGAKMLEIAKASGMDAESLKQLETALAGVAETPVEAEVTLDTASATQQIEGVKTELANVSGSASLNLDTSLATQQIQGVKTELTNVSGSASLNLDTTAAMQQIGGVKTAIDQVGVTGGALGSAVGAALQGVTLSSDATKMAVDALSVSFVTLQGQGSLTAEQAGGVSASLQQMAADGQLTGAEVANMTGQLQAAGVPTTELTKYLLDTATQSGMTTEQLKTLETALASTSDSMTTTGADSTTLAADLTGLTDAEKQTADQAMQTSNDLNTLSGAEQDAAGGALSAGGDTSQFADALSQLQQEGNFTKSEMASLSGAFSEAGGGSLGAAGNIDGLKASLADFGVSGQEADLLVKSFTETLDKIPAEKRVKVIVEQEGEIPAAAFGGVVSGLAWVNERGAEIAKFRNGAMALMTQRGPVLGAFPAGTQIIPHAESMRIMARQPNLPRMATGGTITAAAPTQIININVSGRVLDDAAFKQFTRDIAAEIRRQTSYQARA